MTDRLLDLIQRKGLVLGDGAMGTMLQLAGLTDGGSPELWNAAHPEAVRAIYQGYADAGSDIITTNSFGGTRYRLKLHKLQERVFELNQAAAALAREVAGADKLVAGSMGPTGELMEPLGPLTLDEARAAFAEQAAGLAAGGVDFFLVETMSSLDEVQAAVEGARAASDLPVVVTMTFDTNYRTMMGVTPAQAVQTLHGWGVAVIGANCGNGPAEIERIMYEMAQARPEGVVLMAQSNAGLPRWRRRRYLLRRHARRDGRLHAAHARAGRAGHRRLLRQHAGPPGRHAHGAGRPAAGALRAGFRRQRTASQAGQRFDRAPRSPARAAG